MNYISSVFSQYRGQSRSVYVLFFGRMVTSMGALIWPMMALILSRKMGYTNSQVGLILIIIGVVFLPATWIGGKLADHFNRKRLIIILDSISVLFFIMCAFVEPGPQLLVFFVIAGWFANMEGPVFESLIIDVTKPKERETAFSMVYLGRNLGMIIGSAVGGILFEKYLSVAFIIDGVTTLVSTILIVVFVVVIKSGDLSGADKNKYEEEIDNNERAIDVLKKRKSVFIQIVVFFMTGILYDQVIFSIPLYMTHLFGAQGAYYFGIISSFNALVVIIFTPIMTKISGKYNEIPKIVVGLGLLSISYFLIINKPIYITFFAFIFVFTIGEILNMLGTSPFISRRVPATHRGRINSYVFTAFFLGSIIGKGIVGATIDALSYEVAFLMVSVIGVAAVLLSYYNYSVDKDTFPKLYENKGNLLKEIEKK